MPSSDDTAGPGSPPSPSQPAGGAGQQAAGLDQGRAADAGFAEQLQQALIRMAAAGQLTAPVAHTDVLDLIVGTAAQVLGASAASLYLIDHAANDLVFVVALGESAARARTFRVPVGQGIAGWVAQTGEAALIPDASQDPRFAANIARSIGYIPKSVLCIPMRAGEQIIGVVQLFDKANRAPFTEEDRVLLEEFAAQAAVALEQSRAVRDVCDLFGVVLAGLLPQGRGDDVSRSELAVHARDFAGRTAQSPRYLGALRITQLVSEISRQGGPEGRRLCQELLNSVAEYTGHHSDDTGAAP